MKKNIMIDLNEIRGGFLITEQRVDDVLHLIDGNIIVAGETLNKALLTQAEGMLIVAGCLNLISCEQLKDYNYLIIETRRNIERNVK